MKKDSKIYIAGHTGMVGSAIVRRLRNEGYDNIVTKKMEDLDLTNQVSVKKFFQEEKPEYVFLAAAKVGGILANNTYRAQFIYENLAIETNVIHQSYLNKVTKLLFLGSSCIYPGKCPQPMKEEYLLSSELEYTNEPYAIAKIAGLKLCESYNLQYGTNFLAVMPTNLYGPNDNYNLETSHVVPAMMRKIHLGKCLEKNDWESIKSDLDKRPIRGVDGKSSEADMIGVLKEYGIECTNGCTSIELWGSGKPRREFLHVEDLADSCVFIMKNTNFSDLVKERFGDNKRIRNTHINIGAGKDVTILELSEMLRKIIGFDGEIKWNTDKPDGTFQKLLDVEQIHKLGWREKINLVEGLKGVYEQYL